MDQLVRPLFGQLYSLFFTRMTGYWSYILLIISIYGPTTQGCEYADMYYYHGYTVYSWIVIFEFKLCF